MRKERMLLSAKVLSAALLTGCSSEPPDTGKENTEVQQEMADQTAELKELVEFLGKSDEDVKDLFGGGEENWTEDKGFYIGRIYQIVLGEDEASLYTTCEQDKTVSSVSVKFRPDGEDCQDRTEKWVKSLTEFVGQEPEFDGTSSEGGSQNWKWKTEDAFITLRLLGEDLSISMNPPVGELK